MGKKFYGTAEQAMWGWLAGEIDKSDPKQTPVS